MYDTADVDEPVERAQAGDPDAFCLLVQSCERRLYALAFSLTGSRADADDLSQETWLRAYRGFAGFRGDAAFFTWVRQILLNLFLTRRRLEQRQPAEAWQETAETDAEERIRRRILLRSVSEALTALTPAERAAFLLKHREGMTYEEIAVSLQCSTGAVKKAVFRAMQKLRARLNPKNPVAGREEALCTIAPLPRNS